MRCVSPNTRLRGSTAALTLNRRAAAHQKDAAAPLRRCSPRPPPPSTCLDPGRPRRAAAALQSLRENLKRLCDVVRTVKPLPSIMEKLPVIEKLCAKLEASSAPGSALVSRLRFVGVAPRPGAGISRRGWSTTRRAARSRSAFAAAALPRPPAPSKSSLFDPGAL